MTLNPDLFGKVMRAFSVRTGKTLDPVTYDLTYAGLARHLDDARFQTAAALVYERHVFATIPAVQEFLDADKEARREADAYQRETLRRIDAGRAHAPGPRDATDPVLAAFHAEWTAALAHDDAEPLPDDVLRERRAAYKARLLGLNPPAPTDHPRPSSSAPDWRVRAAGDD